MVSSSSNSVMLTPVLSTVVTLVSLSLSSPFEAPRLSHENSPRRTNPFYHLLPCIDNGDKPEHGNSSTSIQPSLSTGVSFSHLDSPSTHNATPIPSTPVACVQPTNITSPTMLQAFTILELSDLLASSAESTGISNAGFMFTGSSTRELGTASASGMIESSTMEADTAPAPAPVASQYPDTSVTDAFQLLSIYTTADQATPPTQPTILSLTTTPFLPHIASPSLEGNFDQSTMATNNVSRVSPEVESTMVGSPVGYTPVWPSLQSTSTPIPTSIAATTYDNSGHGAVEPTTLKTEASSAITAAASVTSIEPALTTISNVWAMIFIADLHVSFTNLS
jgi:hypothetical protein